MVRMHRTATVAFVALALSLGLAACGDDDEAGTVTATLSDFKIELGSSSAPAGDVTFDVTNDGPSVHEFVVFKTDLAVDALPVDENGDVAEGESFEPVDEIEDIAVDASPSLTVNLTAGKYVIICNVTGHYKQGMSTAFTVT